MKLILSNLFQTSNQKRKSRINNRKQNNEDTALQNNEYFAFDIGSTMGNGRYIKRTYTSTIVETNSEYNIKKNIITDLITERKICTNDKKNR